LYIGLRCTGGYKDVTREGDKAESGVPGQVGNSITEIKTGRRGGPRLKREVVYLVFLWCLRLS
jgi:hypothetical protein